MIVDTRLEFEVGSDGRIVVHAPPGSKVEVTIYPSEGSADLLEMVPSRQHHTGVLSTEDVPKVRQLYATGKYKQSELATMFGVTQSTISQCVNGKTWNR